MRFARGMIDRRLVAAAAIALGLSAVTGSAHAAWDYWMQYGGTKIAKCAGNTTESYIKLSNPDGQWLYIDGVGSCVDNGSEYVLKIKFLRVAVNGARASDIERNPIEFDWLGLELYKQADSQQRIEWLYHDEKPVRGSLTNHADNKLYFGNLSFTVPKAASERATRMTFYLTAKGIPFRFSLI